MRCCPKSRYELCLIDAYHRWALLAEASTIAVKLPVEFVRVGVPEMPFSML
jgi:hypothetical protein